MMRKMGFADRWVDWMFMCMSWIDWMFICMSSVRYFVFVSGKIVGPIVPQRELRQEDPLFPYIFLIYAEGLSKLFVDAERRGRIHGGKTCIGCPKILHIFFAGDSLFFFKAL